MENGRFGFIFGMILISVRHITSYQSELKQCFYFYTFGRNDPTNSQRLNQKAKGKMQIKLGKHTPTSFDYKFMPNKNTIQHYFGKAGRLLDITMVA